MLNREVVKEVITSDGYKAVQRSYFIVKRVYNELYFGSQKDEFVTYLPTKEDAIKWIDTYNSELDDVDAVYLMFLSSECGIILNSVLSLTAKGVVTNFRDYATNLWNRLGDDVKALYDNNVDTLLCYIRVEAYLTKSQSFKNNTFTNDFMLCQCCGLYHNREAFTNNSGFCNDCSTNYAKCSMCGRWHMKNKLLSYKDIKTPLTASEKQRFAKGACQNCVDNLTVEYKQCGYYHDAPQDAPLFYNASRKNTPLITDENTKTRYFGIEFELATDDDELMSIYGDDYDEFDGDDAVREATRDTLEYLSDNGFSRHIYAESDSSIEPLGYEFITNPMSLDYIASSRIINVFLTGAEKHGFYPHDSCGMHVHVNRASLNKYSVAKMNVMLSVLENKDYNGYITRISERETCNEWAKIVNFSEVHYCDSVEEKYACIYDTMRRSDRYVALNSKNKNTVEFRFFGATMNNEVVMERLYFVNALCSFANNNALQACENITPEKLVKWDSRAGDLFDRYGISC